jgi:hypothetical protein
MPRLLPRLVPFLSLIAFGCSSSQDNGDNTPPAMPDMAEPPMPDMSLPKRAPTDHPPLITMDNNGGPTLAAAEVWTIVWKGDEALGQKVQDFTNWMLTNDQYWSSSLGQYAVGSGKGMGVIVLPDTAPATLDDSMVGPMIKAHIADGLFPKPNVNTVLSFVVPEKTQQTMYGGKGCSEYGGYHAETRMATGSTTYVPYAINLQCAGFTGGTLFDSLTMVVSHELAEVATDPHPFTKPAYDAAAAPLGGEVGDLCNPLATVLKATIVDDTDGGTTSSATTVESYYVSRLWSNQAATAGTTDPCVPAPTSHPYFNVAVDPTDVMVTAPTGTKTSDFTAKFEPYAFGDVGEIKWQIEGQPIPGVNITPQSGSAMPGDTILMKLHLDSSASSGSYPIIMLTTAQKGGQNLWTSTVTVQ